MATFENEYTYGRHASAAAGEERVSLVPPVPAPAPAKPEAIRSTRPPEAVSQRSMQVLATLPSAYQMHETRRHYPHVLNSIADAWHDPEFLFHVIRNLLIDQRGGRAGFPFSVLAEVTNLREYYFSSVRPDARARFNQNL